MKKIYDYIIIGGGPSGLILAYLLSKNNQKSSDKTSKSILLIDKNTSLGGCHRVDRNDIYFTEHGPRVYSSAFVNFINILKDLNVDFYDLFVPYNYTIYQIGTNNPFTAKELFKLTGTYIKYLLNLNNFKQISVKEYFIKHKFSEKSLDYLDRLCRLTDGTDSTKYSVFKLMSLINDNTFYKLFQPKYSNDKKLFKIISEKLIENKVSILLNTKIETIDPELQVIKTNSNESFTYKNLVAAIPPVHLNDILKNSNKQIFNKNFSDVANFTNYNKYISITFHWDEKIYINRIHGFPINKWGLIFIILTDYNESEKGTIISVSISKPNEISPNIKKNALEANEKELILETFFQLKDVLKLPKYNKAFVHQGDDTAYIDAVPSEGTFDVKVIKQTQTKIKAKSDFYSNVYSLGTQNCNSNYNFTTIESAIINAIVLYNELNESKKFKIKNGIKLSNIIYLVLFIILLFLIFQRKWNN